MKLSTREDVAVPIEDVFASLTNYDEFERRALRRGADVIRTDPPTGPGLGSVWEATFNFRGRQRDLHAELTTFDAPEKIMIASHAGGLEGAFEVQLVALSPQKTRIIAGLELIPKNLSARLLVQSFKLAKGQLTKRFGRALSDFATGLEHAHNGVKPGVTLS
ncbi:MAG: SRPBCC family protein [Pseudomonadota bacterium]